MGYQCLRCPLLSVTENEAWVHVLCTHQWPKEVTCPTCNQVLEVCSNNRQTCTITCGTCKGCIDLAPNKVSYQVHSQLITNDKYLFGCNESTRSIQVFTRYFFESFGRLALTLLCVFFVYQSVLLVF